MELGHPQEGRMSPPWSPFIRGEALKGALGASSPRMGREGLCCHHR